MQYYTKYYINNKNYYSIDSQKNQPIYSDENEWTSIESLNDITIDNSSDLIPYYLFIKYNSDTDKNSILEKYNSNIISNFSNMQIAKSMTPTNQNKIIVIKLFT